MKYGKLVNDIVANVGGKDNIVNVVHCATRLRFHLKEHTIANTEEIKKLDGVMGVVFSGGQYQIIIGNHVSDVYKDLISVIGVQKPVAKQKTNETKEKDNWFNRFVKMLVGIISPAFGLMTAVGILKGINAMGTAFHWFETTDGTYILLNAIGDGFFYFLPIIIGFSAGKKFGGNPYITASIAAALVYPGVLDAFNAGKPISFLGIPVVLVNYANSLFPIIFAGWLASIVEKWFNSKLHAAIRTFLSPLFTLVIVGVLTFLIVGPILTVVSDQLANGTMWIYGLSPLIAGAVLGAFWQVIVMFGLHYAFIPILINNVTTFGYDPINAILVFTVFAQAGAATAVYFKAKDPKVRSIAGPASVSALLGITEPALYGVNIAHKKPFYMSWIAGGIAGAVVASMGAKMYAFGATSFFAGPLFISPKGIDSSFYAFLIGMVIALLGSFILTYFFGYSENPSKGKAKK